MSDTHSYLSTTAHHAASAVWESLVIPSVDTTNAAIAAETINRASCYLQGMAMLSTGDERRFLSWLSEAASECALSRSIAAVDSWPTYGITALQI